MKLTVIERMMLLGILPEKGDFTTLKLMRKLRETLSFSEEEHTQLHFMRRFVCPKCEKVVLTSAPQIICGDCAEDMKSTDEVRWDDPDGLEKQIYMGDKVTEIITNTLKVMNDNQVLTDQHMSIYEKFVKEEG